VNLFDLTESESHPAYVALEVSNGNRQYDFLQSAVTAALHLNRLFLSESLLKALNFQAIACLHHYAGVYRPCPVKVGEHFHPPEHYRVGALMEDFVNETNRFWDNSDPIVLAAHVLWKLNYIHPFINGNGRTARAACYYVLCVKAGGLLPGAVILPELIRRNRDEYCKALTLADAGEHKPLHDLLSRLVQEQIKGAQPAQQEPEPPVGAAPEESAVQQAPATPAADVEPVEEPAVQVAQVKKKGAEAEADVTLEGDHG
jgi:hypothetical protein